MLIDAAPPGLLPVIKRQSTTYHEAAHTCISLQSILQVPLHLREDFCGTALLASTWCRGDIVKRTAMGLDIDRDALTWGMQRNGEGLAGDAMEQLLEMPNTRQRCPWQDNPDAASSSVIAGVPWACMAADLDAESRLSDLLHCLEEAIAIRLCRRGSP